MQNKTVKFYTLGCKVNQYETQIIREQFQKAGYKEIEHGKHAYVCVINTCTVTHRADRDSLHFIRQERSRNKAAKIIVTGCLTEFDAAKIIAAADVDLIVKNKDKNRIVQLLGNLTHDPRPTTHDPSSITSFKGRSRAFLKIQDGCNYHCSYCKVCLVRGKSRSLNLKDIKAEARALIENGYREIVLCGICLGSYGKDLDPRIGLCEVINELEMIDADFRIRLSSIELGDISPGLIDKIADCEKVCKHLHIPLQSGDEKILKLMKRTYNPGQYVELVRKIRASIPQVAITTDVIIGFPGETQDCFNNTVRLLEVIRPSRMHIFSYSKREGTPACSLQGSVSEDKIKLRVTELNKIAKSLRLEYWQKFIQKTRGVLVESRFLGRNKMWQGYTDNYIRAVFSSNEDLSHRIIPVKLNKVECDFVLATKQRMY